MVWISLTSEFLATCGVWLIYSSYDAKYSTAICRESVCHCSKTSWMNQPEKKFHASLLPRFHLTEFEFVYCDVNYPTIILREPVYSWKFNRWVKLRSHEIADLGLLSISSIFSTITPPANPLFLSCYKLNCSNDGNTSYRNIAHLDWFENQSLTNEHFILFTPAIFFVFTFLFFLLHINRTVQMMFLPIYPIWISSTWIDLKTSETFTDEKFDLFTSMIFFHIYFHLCFVFVVYRLDCSYDDTALNTLKIVRIGWSTRDELRSDEQFQVATALVLRSSLESLKYHWLRIKLTSKYGIILYLNTQPQLISACTLLYTFSPSFVPEPVFISSHSKQSSMCRIPPYLSDLLFEMMKTMIALWDLALKGVKSMTVKFMVLIEHISIENKQTQPINVLKTVFERSVL